MLINSLQGLYTVKKRLLFSPSPAGMSPWPDIIKLFPGQGEFD